MRWVLAQKIIIIIIIILIIIIIIIIIIIWAISKKVTKCTGNKNRSQYHICMSEKGKHDTEDFCASVNLFCA
jgi:flagellar basal body-associated protein FliL